jgi:hypothetical protein
VFELGRIVPSTGVKMPQSQEPGMGGRALDIFLTFCQTDPSIHEKAKRGFKTAKFPQFFHLRDNYIHYHHQHYLDRS